MNYDQFMSQPKNLGIQIQHQLEEAERLKALCERATTVYSDMGAQTSHENQREKWLVKYIDSKNKVEELIEMQSAAEESVRAWLYQHLELQDSSMLEYRYIDGLTNNEIAERMHYSEQYLKSKISKTIRVSRKIYEQQKGV